MKSNHAYVLSIVACVGCDAAVTGLSPDEGVSPDESAATAEARASAVPAAATPAADGFVRDGLRIVPGHAGVSDSGFVKISGEVVNETGGWLELATVDVVLLDAERKPITPKSIAAAEGRGETARVERGYIAPGARSFFTYIRDTRKLPRPYAAHELSARALPARSRRDATLDGLTITKDDDGFSIRGTLRSTGTQGCRSPAIVAAKLDAAGLVIESSSHSIDAWFQKELAPGQTVTAEQRVYDHEGTAAEVKAYATCVHSH